MFIAAGGTPKYQIPNSLRFRSSASAYLSRTFGTPTSNTTWAFSCWIKLGSLGVYRAILSAGTAILYITNGNAISLYNSGTLATSTALFRDPTAHGHLFWHSNGTTIKAYWNNVEVLSYTGTVTAFNSAVAHNIGKYTSGTDYFDGLLSEINFIDGQALTPSSFGETNSDGVWVPKKYTGTYGTNGFYLPFNDGTSATTLCYDRSGNSNNWTPSGISTTAGVTYDWMYDTPTNNYAVLNPINARGAGYSTASEANLKLTGGATDYETIPATLGMSSGKWYWEVTVGTLSTAGPGMGVVRDGYNWSNALRWTYYNTGQKWNNGSLTAYGATFTTNDVIGVAFDADTGVLTFYKNNSSQGTAFTLTTGNTYFPATVGYNSDTSYTNFGQRPFTYTPPTGFKALCTQNLPAIAIPNPKKHFDVAKFAGTTLGATVSVDGNGNNLVLQPDFVWVKRRGASESHDLIDSVRGGDRLLRSDATTAEATNAQLITAFNSNGFTYGNALCAADNYVSWLWKANGAGVTNNAGSITSTVSANTTAGFSIVTYTGATGNQTVGHGLGKTPSFVIVKIRGSAGFNWIIYHSGLTSPSYYLYLNSTVAQSNTFNFFNATAPTSTVFSVGNGMADTNSNGSNYVSYVFAEIPGYSKFGSYVSNATTDNVYVHTGFRTRWLLCKNYTVGGDWILVDTARNTYNVLGEELLPNSSNAAVSVTLLDITANGFKIRTGTLEPGSTGSYIFAAFAESPFGGSNVAPAPAR